MAQGSAGGRGVTKRGALIGCGFFAENHLHAWAEIEGADIVAICDLDQARLTHVGDTFGIAKRYGDPQALLQAETLDFVDIATTVGAHRTLVTLCAPHVKTVICQKPFAETEADAQAMVDACAAHGTHLQVHENFRWQRAFTEMKTLIEADTIGDPFFARFSFRHKYDNFVNQPYLAEIERFTIMDVGLHLFDLARHFMGDVATLSCQTQRVNPIVKGEDVFTALLGHQSGATSICDCSFYSRYDPEPFLRTPAVIEGPKGTLELDRAFGLTIHTEDGVRRVDVEPEVPAWGTKPWHVIQQSVVALQEHALDVMTGGASPQPSGADNLQTLRLALAAYESAARGVTIHMDNWQEPAS